MSIHENLKLTGASNGKRRELDFYPTPVNVTQALLNFLGIPKNRVIADPCCGNHKMSNVFKDYGYETIATDIIYGQDYLSTPIKSDAIITNPPFNISEQIIRKALSESKLVAMLLKSQYWHIAKTKKLFNEFTPTYVLPLTWRPDFMEDEKDKKGSPTMECIWTVWIQPLNRETIYKQLDKPVKSSIIKELDCPYEFTSRCTMGRCDCKDKKDSQINLF